MLEKIHFEDICSPAQFIEQYPWLLNQPGCPKMDYLMRTRHLNGLSDCGAVIEPAQRRPMIVKPKFLSWLIERRGVVTLAGESDLGDAASSCASSGGGGSNGY